MSAAAWVSTTAGMSTTARVSTAAGMSTTAGDVHRRWGVRHHRVPPDVRHRRDVPAVVLHPCPIVSAAVTSMPAAAVSPTTMIGFIAAASVIAAAAAIHKAMPAPAVAIAPAGPGTNAEEDPVVEESRPVKAYRRAGVGWIFVVAVWADRWNADFDVNLCLSPPAQESGPQAVLLYRGKF